MKITILSQMNEKKNSATKLQDHIVNNLGYECNILDLRHDLGNREQYYDQIGEIVIPRITGLGRITTSMILMELEELGKFIFPRTLLEDSSIGYKHYQQSAVKSLGVIECIPSFVLNYPKDIQKLFDNQKLKFPFIIKPTSGSEGEGIEVFSNASEWSSFINKWDNPNGHFYIYIIQNFISNKHDYRVFVIGEKAVGIMKRSRTKGFVNNFSQGGTVENVELNSEIGKKLSNISINICKGLNIDIAGVDIIEDLDGKLYFMEINTTAQWKGLEIATGIDVEVLFLDECLKKYKQFQDNK